MGSRRCSNRHDYYRSLANEKNKDERDKKFSETLEIYIEIAKQYPVVRQIQETMQGIYAMEQQSAGEVKIF